VNINNGVTDVADYEYDDLFRRTRKTTYSGGTTVRDYYYSDAWQVLEEQVSSVADRQYVWGIRYIDDCVLRDRSDAGTLDERLYALQDANWNVVALVGFDDPNWAVVQRFAYSPYGVSLPLNANFTPYDGTDYEWEYRYTGRRLDLETALYQYRNRYYHAELGRFISRDPFVYRGDMNLHAYASHRPLNFVDPMGDINLSYVVYEPGYAALPGLTRPGARPGVKLFFSVSETDVKYITSTNVGTESESVEVRGGWKEWLNIFLKGVITVDFDFLVVPDTTDTKREECSVFAGRCCWIRPGRQTKCTNKYNVSLRADVYRNSHVTAEAGGGLLVGGVERTKHKLHAYIVTVVAHSACSCKNVPENLRGGATRYESTDYEIPRTAERWRESIEWQQQRFSKGWIDIDFDKSK
jgi:RHS repeat-associated protein